MHKPFVRTPEWLVGFKEVDEHNRRKTPFFSIANKNSLSQLLLFQLSCFESLYKLGLNDRQVIELTALMILLYRKQDCLDHIPVTKERVLSIDTDVISIRWMRVGFGYFWYFESLDEFFREWIDYNLNKRDRSGEAFCLMDYDWPLSFLDGDRRELDLLTGQLRILFAQHCFSVMVTGSWNPQIKTVCKRYQELFPKSMIPWRQGNLDGFTYKLLAKSWRKSKGLAV